MISSKAVRLRDSVTPSARPLTAPVVRSDSSTAWLAILRQVEGSVLWLAEDNEWSRQALP